MASNPILGQIQGMCIYLFQTYQNEGLEQGAARVRVARELLGLANEFSAQSGYDTVTASILVDTALKQVKEGASREVVQNTLVNLKTAINKEGSHVCKSSNRKSN